MSKTPYLHHLIGSALEPVDAYEYCDGPIIIVHCCNNRGFWGRGFVMALSKKWPELEIRYRAWAKRHNKNIPGGAVQMIRVETSRWSDLDGPDQTIFVANMIGQEGVKSQSDLVPPVRYEWIERGLTFLAGYSTACGASVHMPRIGCRLAGGSWPIVEAIIDRTLGSCDIPTFVYTLPNEVELF